MNRPAQQLASLLGRLVALDPCQADDAKILAAEATTLERESAAYWTLFDPDDFHEIQHYVMACESPHKNADWKKSLDERMLSIVAKLQKKEADPDRQRTTRGK